MFIWMMLIFFFKHSVNSNYLIFTKPFKDCLRLFPLAWCIRFICLSFAYLISATFFGSVNIFPSCLFHVFLSKSTMCHFLYSTILTYFHYYEMIKLPHRPFNLSCFSGFDTSYSFENSKNSQTLLKILVTCYDRTHTSLPYRSCVIACCHMENILFHLSWIT